MPNILRAISALSGNIREERIVDCIIFDGCNTCKVSDASNIIDRYNHDAGLYIRVHQKISIC